MYLDETHIRDQQLLHATWQPKGKQLGVKVEGMPTTLHLFGALDVQSGEVQVASTERCNAQSFELFLNQLLKRYPDQHLFIILDNARYHHARYLHPFLEKVKDHLTLWFLPPYSPELNLIERFWKWLKGTVVANCYYPDRSALLSSVQNFLDMANQAPQKVLKRIGFSC